MSRSIANALSLLVVLPVAVGCVSSTRPRPAQPLRAGEAAIDLRLSPAGYASGVGELTKLTDETLSVEGNTAPRFRVSPLGTVPLWFWVEYTIRVGLYGPCEVGIDYGLMAQGGELRCGLVDERRGGPFSLALLAGSAHHPFQFDKGPVFRTGVEASIDLDHAWTLAAASTLAVGPHAHALDVSDIEAKFRPPPPDDLFGGWLTVDPYAWFERNEWRLTAALSAIWKPDDSVELSLGVAPYFILHHGPVTAGECVGCVYLEPSGLAERTGVTATLGFSGRFGDAIAPSAARVDAVPAGYHRVTRWDPDLWGAGLGIGLFPYGFFVPVLMFAVEGGNQSASALATAAWFVPVAGPIVWRQQLGSLDEPVADAGADVLGYGSALVEAAGVLMIVLSWVYEDETIEADRPSSSSAQAFLDHLLVAPTWQPDQVGVVARGRFF